MLTSSACCPDSSSGVIDDALFSTATHKPHSDGAADRWHFKDETGSCFLPLVRRTGINEFLASPRLRKTYLTALASADALGRPACALPEILPFPVGQSLSGSIPGLCTLVRSPVALAQQVLFSGDQRQRHESSSHFGIRKLFVFLISDCVKMFLFEYTALLRPSCSFYVVLQCMWSIHICLNCVYASQKGTQLKLNQNQYGQAYNSLILRHFEATVRELGAKSSP